MRVAKKLMPQLGNISGAVIMVNASDPQISTYTIFEDAVRDIPYITLLNKCDLIPEEEIRYLLTRLGGRYIIPISLKKKKGLARVYKSLDMFKERVIILGVFNSGKTSLVNLLTKERNPTGDLPGTTLELTEHKYKNLTLIDTVGQIIDISKPMMVSIDLSECKTIEERLTKCFQEDIKGIEETLKECLPSLEKAAEVIIGHIEAGGKVITVGAGASSLVAMEIAGQGHETGIPIMVFTNNISTAQPISFAKGFAEEEKALAEYYNLSVNPEDVVIGISASGGTAFVYLLLQLAKKKGATTISITENRDTPLGKASDIIIKSEAKPEGPSSSKIQIAHLAIGHALILTVADLRGVTAERAIGYMLPDKELSKKIGIK